MSFIPKISEAFASNVEKLPNRFNQGFMKMGIVERTPRNNSTSEIQKMEDDINRQVSDLSDKLELFAYYAKEDLLMQVSFVDYQLHFQVL